MTSHPRGRPAGREESRVAARAGARRWGGDDMSSAAPRILRGVEAFRSRSFLAMLCSKGRRFESGRAARGTPFRLWILCRGESPVRITRRVFFHFEPTEGAQRFFWTLEGCSENRARSQQPRIGTGRDLISVSSVRRMHGLVTCGYLQRTTNEIWAGSDHHAWARKVLSVVTRRTAH